jgi:dihydrolipoamide dehydrogenase
MKEYDVIVIGSGPGGYVCAIRCAQLGFKTAIVEKYNTLGGTCLNVGCIPSKAYLDSSEKYHELIHSYADHGIEAKSVSLDFDKLKGRVKKVVSDTCAGVEFLMSKNKIDVFHGVGTFKTDHVISISGEKNEEVSGKKIVIATGSKPASLPGIEIDKKRIITSTEALDLGEIPKELIVVGGGVIGIELGSVYARLGSKVSIVEYADSVLATMDADISKGMKRVLKDQNIELYTSHMVKSVTATKSTVTLKVQNLKTDKEVTLKGNYCLMSVGRKPNTQGLGLENIGLKLDDRGRVDVNDQLQTSISHIYAIGDVIKGAMLAHKAEDEGMFVAELMAGQKPHIDYNCIPGVVYTWPEAASVGKTEKELKDAGVKFKKGSFPFKASGRARASNESLGFIKVLADSETDEILGVHMLGPRCADLIAEAVLAMEYKASAEDIARICHPHPTYTEAFKEACLAATENRALHF